MARNTMEAWIPEEYDSAVIQRITQTSVIEALANRLPMTSDTRHAPRSAGMGVEVIDKGGAYGEDTSLNDDVVLTAKKFGKVVRIAEEDINDALPNTLAVKMKDWGISYAKILDNACLGVTAAPGAGVPFQSLYSLLNTTDATLGYTGGDNITTAASSGATYDDYSTAIGDVEAGDYYDPATMISIAHPSFKKSMRGIKDSQQRPIFIEGLAGTPDTIFSVPIHWSLGARQHATATAAPTGRPLMAFVSTDLMLLGIRSGPESVFIDGRDGTSALTDESLLKMRARRGWAYGHPAGASILVG
ncbi:MULTISPECIES: phage major capsid protein [Streptomyces]|uniref:Phage major capsid protein n=1 Tax=Streptomyces dengpaensis TaxID=2049881 RepID=A0ABN5I9Y7_9ACTN|nr:MULTISPECIES: phage major capsid protein [Streptomyces]AVH60002.1 phage major capsid protein [Streptomyces dengpaensis]PIB09640.1 major capsid protein [Streptomyces sp. HG99]